MTWSSYPATDYCRGESEHRRCESVSRSLEEITAQTRPEMALGIPSELRRSARGRLVRAQRTSARRVVGGIAAWNAVPARGARYIAMINTQKGSVDFEMGNG